MNAGHAYMAGTAAVYVNGVKLGGVVEVEYSSGAAETGRAPAPPSPPSEAAAAPSSFSATAAFFTFNDDALEELTEALRQVHRTRALPSIAIGGHDVGLVTSTGDDYATFSVAPWPHVLRACEARARGWLRCQPRPRPSLTSMIRAWWELTPGRRARLNRRLKGRPS
jgi:hypothetical protein